MSDDTYETVTVRLGNNVEQYLKGVAHLNSLPSALDRPARPPVRNWWPIASSLLRRGK
jgi:hypothetical protein